MSRRLSSARATLSLLDALEIVIAALECKFLLVVLPVFVSAPVASISPVPARLLVHWSCGKEVGAAVASKSGEDADGVWNLMETAEESLVPLVVDAEAVAEYGGVASIVEGDGAASVDACTCCRDRGSG